MNWENIPFICTYVYCMYRTQSTYIDVSVHLTYYGNEPTWNLNTFHPTDPKLVILTKLTQIDKHNINQISIKQWFNQKFELHTI